MTPTQRADTRTEDMSWVIEVTYNRVWYIVHKRFGGQSSDTENNMIPTTLEACVEAFQQQLPDIKKLTERDNRRTNWRVRNVMTDEIIMIDALTC